MRLRTRPVDNVMATCPKCKKERALLYKVGINSPYVRAFCIRCWKEIFAWNPLKKK